MQEEALHQVTSQLGGSYPLVIGGEAVRTGRTIRSTSPSDPNLLVGEVAAAGPEEAVKALEAAQRAFEPGAGPPPSTGFAFCSGLP